MNRQEVIQQIRIEENRFGYEPEINAKLAALEGCRIFEVGIRYYGRTYAGGKRSAGVTASGPSTPS